MRLILISVFAASGLGALVLSTRNLMNRERSAIVWAALAVGVCEHSSLGKWFAVGERDAGDVTDGVNVVVRGGSTLFGRSL